MKRQLSSHSMPSVHAVHPTPQVAASGAPELRVNSNGAGPVSAEWMVGDAGIVHGDWEHAI